MTVKKILTEIILFASMAVVLLSIWAVVSWHHLSEYDAETNNCLMQSSAIVKWCSQNGIDAVLVYGEVYKDGDWSGNWSAHAWVRFYGFYDFDAVSWLPCDMSRYKPVATQRYDTITEKFL